MDKRFQWTSFYMELASALLKYKAKTSYTLSTRRLRFGYEQQFSRSTPRAYYGMVGEEFTAYLILEMAGAIR